MSRNWSNTRSTFFTNYCQIVKVCMTILQILSIKDLKLGFTYLFSTKSLMINFRDFLKWIPDLISPVSFFQQSSSVIRQKGESQNWCFKKTKHAKFPQKRTFLNKCLFFRKFSVLCSLETPVLRLVFLSYYRRVLPCDLLAGVWGTDKSKHVFFMQDKSLKIFKWF